MFYYLVWVRSNRYHSKTPLTYSYKHKLLSGSLIQVKLQSLIVDGFIVGSTTKPRFKTKEIDLVYDLPPINTAIIKLAKWILEYYPSPIGSVTQQIIPAKIRVIGPGDDLVDTLRAPTEPKLTQEQQSVIEDSVDNDTYLLYGKTGSGKTRIYTELTRSAFKIGKSAIILTPEISLTSQLFNSFQSQFGDRALLIHSRLTSKQRQLLWLRCLTSDKPLVVIGPRSALFSPLKNLGLIVIDEAHEAAYKQEQMPHYQTTRVASVLSKLTNSKLIIGSATPSVADYFMAENKSKKILRLTKLAKESDEIKPEVVVVDLKDKSNFSSSHLISDRLMDSIKLSLNNNEQSLLYLNRRGTSRLILCQNCGWEAVCPNCNLPLVYHADHHQLRCHTCGYKEDKIPSICPNCDNDSIIFRTVGTKAIVDEISRLFVTAKIARFDTDNLKEETMANQYDSIKNGSVDILIGTQLLAKGLDLPKLSTVGVIQADTSLYLPDFSAQERTFQLITQVIGRVNRGHIKGRAIIQTYNPDSQIIKQAISEDYENFYKNELLDRERFHFPPYYHLLKLWCRRSSSKNAEAAAHKLKTEIGHLNLGVQIEGPTPAFHEKFQNKYQWQLVVKSTNRKHLTDVISKLPANWSYDIDPLNLL
ncbi:MAG TPA: primosomal protein N' [Candidatus Saccharimonadales bacterium]